MADFFTWLAGGSLSSTLFIIIVTIIGIVAIVAILQGREVSFYPPKIGPRKVEEAKKDSIKLQNLQHFRSVHTRNEFNELGINILKNSEFGDTVYLILRTGSLIKDFATALRDSCQQKDTKLIVIVPNSQVFLAEKGYGEMLEPLITELHENPKCEDQRGLVLEPGIGNPSEGRIKGYFFVSDGIKTELDGGFSTETKTSSKFLLEYCKMLIKTGSQILPK